MYNIKISKTSLDTKATNLTGGVASLLYLNGVLTVTLKTDKDNYGLNDGLSASLFRKLDLGGDLNVSDSHRITVINDRKFSIELNEDRDIKIFTYGDDIITKTGTKQFLFTVDGHHDVDKTNVNITKLKAYCEDGYYIFTLRNVEVGMFKDYIRENISAATVYSASLLEGTVSGNFTKYDGTVVTGESDDIILAKLLRATFQLCDGRFLNAGKTALLSGVTLNLINTTLKLDLPADAFQSPSLGHLDDVKTMFVDRVMENRIPNVIDMEKSCVCPIISGDTVDDVETIKINLHTRTRTSGDNWTVIESGYWPGCDGTMVPASGLPADTLFDLGFNDSDVKYRKKRLVNSFIRLSFYDSKEMLDQGLLFYSTIFMDATALLNEYNNYLVNDVEEDPVDVVKQMTSQVEVHNKYYTRKSSEGFYLYLFNDFLKENMEGNDMTIYMKVEYNHAGYGTTVPFIMFKDGYTHKGYVGGGSNNTRFLYEKYKDDVFIEVKVHYNQDKDRLEYYIPGARNHELCIELDLYEPRIKGNYDN